MRDSLTAFELKVMDLALRGKADWIAGARKQLPYLTVSGRSFTEGGFVTAFKCDDNAVPVQVPSQPNGLPVMEYPPTVNALRRLPSEGLVSFMVWLDTAGKIVQLEACSLTDDQWPENPYEGFYNFQDDSGNIISKD